MTDSTTHTSEPCKRLAWDSDFFGFCVASVRTDALPPSLLPDIDAWCVRHQVRCLYFLAKPDEATSRQAMADGFRQVDQRMTLELMPAGLPPATQTPAPTQIRPAKSTDLPGLTVIAAAVHTDTRFFRDPHFSRERSRELYRIWITQSVQGDAQKVFVAVSERDSPVGYVTCRVEGSENAAGQKNAAGQIGLLGVSEEAQGKGIGRALVSQAVEWFHSQGIRQVSVVIQGHNQRALRTYQSCGFRTRLVQNWFHKWYPQEA